MQEKNNLEGHRKRLKERFLNNIEKDVVMADYEILEVFLFFIIPRVDVKPLAKDLLSYFKNLKGVFYADKEELMQFKHITENAYVLIVLFRQIVPLLLKVDLENKPILGSWQQLLDYCYANLAYRKTEFLQILYLNTKNILIKDEVLQEGSINTIVVDPKDILRRCIRYKARSIILVHNHPSGVLEPSSEDIVFTLNVIKVLKPLDISVHDHVIVSPKGIISLKQYNLM